MRERRLRVLFGSVADDLRRQDDQAFAREDGLPLRRRAVATLVGFALACSVPPQVRITVLPGSTVRALRLEIQADGVEPGILALRVAGSRLSGGRHMGSQGQILWVLMPSDGRERPLPRMLTYGVAPAGFTGSVPIPLTPGKYEVEVVIRGVSALSHFTVATDGTISS